MSIKVKALRWEKSHIKPWNGDYHTIPTGFTVRCADENGWKWSGLGGFGYSSSPEGAMDRAQREHESYILSAIEPSPDMREAVEALERANALTSAGNRTFDELTRDVTRANGEIRMALNIAYALTGAKP